MIAKLKLELKQAEDQLRQMKSNDETNRLSIGFACDEIYLKELDYEKDEKDLTPEERA